MEAGRRSAARRMRHVCDFRPRENHQSAVRGGRATQSALQTARLNESAYRSKSKRNIVSLARPRIPPIIPPPTPPPSATFASDERILTTRNIESRNFEPCHPPFSARNTGGAYNGLRPRLEELRKQFLGNGKQSCKSGSRYAIAADAPGERRTVVHRSPQYAEMAR